MSHVFISYSRQDTAFVEKLERTLNQRGIVTWRDVHSIPGGTRWFRRIKAGLESSFAVIYVDTSSAEASDWVEKEFMYAQVLGLPILPLKLDTTFMSMYTINLNPILCDDTHFEAGMVELEAQLRTLPQQPIKAGAQMPLDDLPDTSDPIEDAAASEKDIQDYLDWLLAQAQADLRDALYVDLAATPERPVIGRVKLRLAFGLGDDEFAFTHIGLEQLVHEDFGKPGKDVPDARQAIRDLRRVVLLGDPGAGKTTTLLKLAVDLARAAQIDPTAKLPIYIPLREFDGSTPFGEFVQSQAYNLGSRFGALLGAGRWVLLGDALNEMPRTSADGRDLVAEVREYLKDKADWVVSCRVRDYTDDLSSLSGISKIRLKPLDPPRIEQFIRRKYVAQPERGAALWAAMGGSELLLRFWERITAKGETERFWDAHADVPSYISSDEDEAWRAMHREHRHLLALCRNPFMANMVCALYRSADKLPDNRAGLFADFVANLLRHEQTRLESVGLTWIGDTPIRVGMEQIAWAMGAQTEMGRETAEAILSEVLPDDDPARLLSAAASAQIIDYGASIRFSHQLVQQYFAASMLGALMDSDSDPAAIWAPEDWWLSTGREETAIFLAGDRHDPEGVARWIALAQPELAYELLMQPDFNLDLDWVAPATKEALVSSATLKKAETAPEARAAAYRVLGRLQADTRRGVGVVDGLPEIDWCEVPEGAYIYQVGEQRILPTFYIARYPITAVQFQAFLDAPDGFANPRWWPSMGDYERQALAGQHFDYPNHPRENVSWYQAAAFTHWLDAQYRERSLLAAMLRQHSALDTQPFIVRLPTEEEWEKAARGMDGREYPWDGDFDTAKCNTLEGNIQQTTAVGLYPQGAAPCGALDMAGNVWEWCLNKYEQPRMVDIDATDDPRAVRGGSWDFDEDYARATRRVRHDPSNLGDFQGFRVVLAAPI